MDFSTILNKILLGDTKLAGLRTIIVNTLMLIIAAWTFFSKDGGLFEFLCSTSDTVSFMSVFCGIGETQFYATALIVITALNNVLRWLTVAPVGVNTTPAQVTAAVETPNPKRQAVGYIVALSVGMLLFLIIRAFV
jgi:hypothetical protein